MKLSDIVSCLKEAGYSELTELQKKSVIELSKGNRSAIIIAPTGSGKTEAAVFPIMIKIISRGSKPITAIYLTPLRALNRDIERRLRKLSKCFGLNVAVRHGDTPVAVRKKIAQNPPHILITTPESLSYIVVNEKLRRYLHNLEYVIIDEFRDLLESKRGLMLLTILYLMELYLNKTLVKIALTATLQEDAKACELLLSESSYPVMVLRDPSLKKLDVKVVVPACRTEMCKEMQKIIPDKGLAARLEKAVNTALSERYVLLFTNTRSLAESLCTLLESLLESLNLKNIKVSVHHGSLSRSHRERVEKEFRERELNVLVSTSSLELGIDIGHVEYVIQYMSPRQALRLIQRVGRSRHRLGDISRGMIIVPGNPLHILEALVLANKARKGALEREVVIPKPTDVLAFTIALYTLLNPNGVPTSKLYEDLKKYALYSELTLEEFNDVLNYLAYARIIKIEKDIIMPTRKTKLYVYKTSMIPTTREVYVVDITSGDKVGVLDEEYVVVNLSENDVIVLAGKPWRIVSYDGKEAKLYVEPAHAVIGEVIIPHWEGENIPVEYSVAQEVARSIKYIKERRELPSELKEILDLEEEIDIYKSVIELGDIELAYVDYVDELKLIIVNIYGGSKVNSLMRDLIKFVLKIKYPYVKFSAYSTPYAIYIQIVDLGTINLATKDIVDLVYDVTRSLYNYSNRAFIERVARNSSLYLWRVYQVAQRFGAISPETTNVSKRMLEAFMDTIIGKEALKEVLLKDYDISSFTELAKHIHEGKVKVVFRSYNKLADHHVTLLEYIGTPFTKELTKLDVRSFLGKLLDRQVTILCLRCGYYRKDRVKEILKLGKFVCPSCGYATLTLVKGDASREPEVVKKLKRGAKLLPDEKKLYEDLVERAILLYRHGDKAVMALSTLGVSTREAVRIINSVLSGSDLVSELYEREKRFFKIKKYLEGGRNH